MRSLTYNTTSRLAMVVLTAMAIPVGVLVTPSSSATPGCGYVKDGSSQRCSAVGEGTLRVGTTHGAVAACTATTPWAVQGTIVQCRLVSDNKQDVVQIGRRTTTGHTATVQRNVPSEALTRNNYSVCVRAGYVDTDNRRHRAKNWECTPAS